MQGDMPTNTMPANSVSTADTQTTTQGNATITPTVENNPGEKQVKTYTREQVTDMMKRRIERSHKNFFSRYNVADLKALDELFDRSKAIQTQLTDVQLKNAELTKMNAFLRNNIDEARYDDIANYFKGTGLDFSEEELLKAIGTHPEWLKPSNVPTNVTTIKTLGSEAHIGSQNDDATRAGKLLGVKF